MGLLAGLLVALLNTPAVAQQADRLTHLVQITADVEVGGQSVRYDELVECRPVHSERSRRAGFEIRRPYIAKVAGGGALVLHLPAQFCELWHHTWNSARSSEAETRLSPRYLPRFYWLDDVRNPTFIEAFLSEAYYEQANKRVNLKRFQALPAPYPIEAALLKRARYQETTDPPTTLIHARGCGAYCWQSIEFAPIAEGEWRQVPELAASLDSIKRDTGILHLSEAQAKLLDRFKLNKIVSWVVLQSGIPRQGEDHGLIGWPPRSQLSQLSRDRLARVADELIPTRCAKDTCRLLLEERGYVIYYRKEKLRDPDGFQWIEIDGTRISQRDYSVWRGAVFVPRIRTVLLRDTSLR